MRPFFDKLKDRWPAGREDLHYHVLPARQHVSEWHAEYYEPLTHREGLVPVRPEDMHITVLHSAPMNQVTEEQMADIHQILGEQLAVMPQFPAVIYPPEIWDDAVVCPVRPGKNFRHLWVRAYEATCDVLGRRLDLRPRVHYYPHMTLAYCVADQSPKPLKEWLSDHAGPPTSLQVNLLTVVAQKHDGRRITWGDEIVEGFLLGAGPR